jgi:hypothetical protein
VGQCEASAEESCKLAIEKILIPGADGITLPEGHATRRAIANGRPTWRSGGSLDATACNWNSSRWLWRRHNPISDKANNRLLLDILLITRGQTNIRVLQPSVAASSNSGGGGFYGAANGTRRRGNGIQASGRRLPATVADPSPWAGAKLRSQIPEAGAVCGKSARTVLCAVRAVIRALQFLISRFHRATPPDAGKMGLHMIQSTALLIGLGLLTIGYWAALGWAIWWAI